MATKKPTNAFDKHKALRANRAFQAFGRKATYALSYAAANQSRLRRNLFTYSGSVNSAYSRFDHNALREKARYCYRNSAVYKALVDRRSDLCVGRGMKPISSHEQLEDYFTKWSETIADASGCRTFEEMQWEISRDLDNDGDIGILFLNDGSLQIIESARIASKLGETNRQDFVDGIELDKFGKPQVFHIVEYTDLGMDSGNRIKVSADDFVFLANRDFATQTRGTPALAACLDRFIDLDQYTQFALNAASMAASVALIAETPNTELLDEQLQLNFGTENQTGPLAQDQAMDGGLFLMAPPGTSIKQIQGEQPTDQYAPFIDKQLRQCGAGAGLPIEVGLMDYSAANYSSARMAENAANNAMDKRRGMFTHCFLDRVWRHAINYGIASGELEDIDINDPSIYEVTWTRPKRLTHDLQQDIQAYVLMYQHNLITKEEIVAEYGRNYFDVIKLRTEEARLETEGNITPPVTPGSTPSVIVNPPAPSQSEATPEGQTAPQTAPKEAPTPSAPSAPSAPVEALTGIQIEQLGSIIDSVSQGIRSPKAASIQIRYAFPTITEEDIAALIDAAINFKPTASSTPTENV